MRLAAEAPAWLALIFALLLIAGAAEDAARLRISNFTCALILAGAVVAMIALGPEIAAWQNFAVFAALLTVGMPLFAAGKLGGGDVKLFAASGLWFDIQGALLMLVTVLLAGGVLALLVLAARMFNWSETALGRVQLLNAGAGIPYGVAIAVGVLLTTAMLRD
jgi:prepilin peptidase CpaA